MKAEKLTKGNSKTYNFLAFDSLNLTCFDYDDGYEPKNGNKEYY